MNSFTMPFNWFDFVLVTVLIVGLFRGRKRGMSEELLDLLKWLTIVVVGSLLYKPAGEMLASNSDVSLLTAYVGAYLGILILVHLLFTAIKRAVGEKLVGSDLFGRSEYYLGMVAGSIRFTCGLLVALALFHAKYVSPEKLASQKKVQQDNFGDISFPTFASMQYDVFYNSLAGPIIREHLREQLIAATPSDARLGRQESLRNRRERELDEVFGSKR